jgi:hypothetical protein
MRHIEGNNGEKVCQIAAFWSSTLLTQEGRIIDTEKESNTRATQACRSMTLKPYDPEMLDQFALELLDLAAIMREMATRSREYEIGDFALHDKKAKEWLDGMARWVRKSQAELELKVLDVRANRRAMSLPD